MSLYVPVLAQPPASPVADGFILAPCAASFSPSHRDLASLLPVADVNAATLGALQERSVPAGGIAGFMLVDPFLRLHDVRLAMADANVTRIANYPTVQLIDGETARALDSARLGVAREIDMLASFRDAGFETVAFATTLQSARAMLEHGTSMLVLHPGLAVADWRERANAGLGLVRFIHALRNETHVPLLVYRPYGFGHELDQAIELAEGVVAIED